MNNDCQNISAEVQKYRTGELLSVTTFDALGKVSEVYRFDMNGRRAVKTVITSPTDGVMPEVRKVTLWDFEDNLLRDRELLQPAAKAPKQGNTALASEIPLGYTFSGHGAWVAEQAAKHESLLERLSSGCPDESERVARAEPNFATAWDDAAIESIVNKCFSYIIEDFDLSRIDHECLRCDYRNAIVLASEIRSLIKGVFLGHPHKHCSNFILNRFEQSVIRSIAAAHRDYDHWNDK